MDKPAVEPGRLLWSVRHIRIVLPFTLFIMVVIYEAWEDWALEGGFAFDFHLISEGFVFGVLGPTAVFFVLSYIIALLRQQAAVAHALAELNQNLEQKVAERTKTLATANAELQQLDQMKSNFISLVSHQLRAPLTILNGGLEMALQAEAGLPPQTRRILEVTASESDRLTRLAKTILDISQLNAGKLPLNPGPVAIFPLLKRTVDLILPDGRRPLVWQIQPNLPPLWADEIYVEEIMRNLLGNVEKYTLPAAPVEIRAVIAGKCAKISVTDHGPGIPAPQQERIFDRFYRYEERDQVSSSGWGLGLYFARELAEAQGGNLTVISPVHKPAEAPGACFTLVLPVVTEPLADEVAN